MSLTSQKMIWKLILMAFGSYMHFLFHFSEFLSHLWVFMILLDLFLNSCWNLLIWVFWRFSCNIWDFWIFIWAMIPNWGWIEKVGTNSGQSEIWYCGQSAGKGRTVRRSWNLLTRGSADKFSTAKIHCGQSAKRPRTVREWTERRILTYHQLQRKVTNIGLILSHLYWKVLKLKSSLQVIEEPRFGFEMI